MLTLRGSQLHHYTALGQQQPPATLLFGFSSGGELAGLPTGAAEGLALISDGEISVTPALGGRDLTGPVYRLRFDQYLERLRHERVNYLKVLVFDSMRRRWSPYDTTAAGGGSGSITSVSPAYLARLEELVRKARQRGIVICLSLFASRMLREPGWSASPFNAANNNTGSSGSGAFVTGPGPPLEQFCVVRRPAEGRPLEQMTVPEKLYVVQRELVTRLVETTRRYWNVVYEICDDPRGPDEFGAMAEVVPWHATVAGWLRDLLTDRRGRRRRFVSVQAGPRLRATLLDALAGMVDLVHLRGREWGGYPCESPGEACGLRSGQEPGRRLLAPSAITGGIEYAGAAWPGIDSALAELAARPLAVVLDADAHHLAQKYPRRYRDAALGRRAHFAYRWTDTYLHRVDAAKESCDKIGQIGQICPATGSLGYYCCVQFGLDQRLDLLTVPEGDDPTTRFPLPPPPPAPRNLTATMEGEYLVLRFDRPPGTDSYALFVGNTAETVWEGTDLFPDPIPIEPAPGGGRVRLPEATNVVEAYVAVAAVRGLLTSDLSTAVGPIALGAGGAVLVAAEWPNEVETRRDLRASLTFRNGGREVWRAADVGVLLEAAGMTGGLATLFFPLGGRNTAGVDTVAPGQTVTVRLEELALDGAFAEYYGERVATILPYSRRPIRFRAGVVRRPSTRLGAPVSQLPDGRPIQVLVRAPRRLATRHVPETQELVKTGFVLPLADGIDRAIHLASVVAAQGEPSAKVHTAADLDRLIKEEGMATRVLRLMLDGAPSVQIDVDVVRLHPIDLYYGLPVRPPRRRSHALAAGADDAAPLDAFAGGMTRTIASSATAIPGHEVIQWETVSGPAGAWLALHSRATVPVNVVSFTAEMVEDPAGADTREIGGSMAFAPGDPPRYAPLGPFGDASKHHFLIHRLSVQGGGGGTIVAHGAVVLRAGADGRFERVLEIQVGGQTAAVTVVWRVREIQVDAAAATARASADLHPAHAARVLQFFNDVESADQIVDTVRDNRSYRRDTKRAYAIRPKLAATILTTRGKLPGGRFETIQQIESIPGVGPDTFEDIAYTFEDDGTPIGLP